jgi:hypothetical protein
MTLGSDEAFTILRSHARSHGLRLSDLARGVVETNGVADMSLNSTPRFKLLDSGGIAASEVAHDADRGDATVTPGTDDPSTHMLGSGDDGSAPDLSDLVRTGMRERGWSYSDLQRASNGALTRGRWQQLGSGVPQRKFPDPASLTVISQVLEVDITTVVLAAARSVGLDVSREGAELSHLLPERTELLTERMRDAILTLIRATVAAAEADRGAAVARAGLGLRLEWPKRAASPESAPEQPGRPGQH